MHAGVQCHYPYQQRPSRLSLVNSVNRWRHRNWLDDVKRSAPACSIDIYHLFAWSEARHLSHLLVVSQTSPVRGAGRQVKVVLRKFKAHAVDTPTLFQDLLKLSVTVVSPCELQLKNMNHTLQYVTLADKYSKVHPHAAGVFASL